MRDTTPLKKIIDDYVKEGFEITYPSFIQFYKTDKLKEDITKYIIIRKRAVSVRYFIKNSDIDLFKEALNKQFN